MQKREVTPETLALMEESIRQAQETYDEAREDKNRTAQANALSRLYTMRMDCDAARSSLKPRKKTITPEQARDAIIEGLAFLTPDGLVSVRDALAAALVAPSRGYR